MNRIPDSHWWVDDTDGEGDGLDVNLPAGLVAAVVAAGVAITISLAGVVIWAIIRLVSWAVG